MAHDWLKPTTSSLKTDFPTEIRNGLLSLAKADLSGDTNIPTNAIQYNQTNKRFEKYNGSSWATLNLHDVIPDKAGTESITGAWSFAAADYLTLPTDIRGTAGSTLFQMPNTTDDFRFHFGGTKRARITEHGLVLDTPSVAIFGVDTIPGADNKLVSLTASSDDTETRGARVHLRGNDIGTVPGNAYLDSGNVAGAVVHVRAMSTTGIATLQNSTGTASVNVYGASHALWPNHMWLNTSGQIVCSAADGIILEPGLGKQTIVKQMQATTPSFSSFAYFLGFTGSASNLGNIGKIQVNIGGSIVGIPYCAWP